MRGGELCLEALCRLFPDAPIFTLLHLEGTVSETIASHEIRTSWLQKMPGVRTRYRNYLPLFPAAAHTITPMELLTSIMAGSGRMSSLSMPVSSSVPACMEVRKGPHW